VLLFVTLLCAAGLKSYRDLTAARAHERQLETRIEATRGGIERLRGRIERVRGDPAMLERLAREDLGLVRRQDVVIELPREGGEDAAPAPGPIAAPAPAAPPSPPASPSPPARVPTAAPAAPLPQAPPAPSSAPVPPTSPVTPSAPNPQPPAP